MSLINAQPSPVQQATQALQGPPAQQEPQGKEMFGIITGQMMNALYDSKDMVLEALQAGGQQESATVLARFMVMMLNSLRMQGKRVPPGVMILAMVELAKGLGELAIQAGVMDDDPRMIEEMFFAAIAKADDELQAEALGEQERQQYAQLMQQMRQMQQGYSRGT